MNQTTVLKKMELPLIQVSEENPDHFISYYLRHKVEIQNWLQKVGAIKFRGIHIDSFESFQRIVDGISSKFLNYVDGNSPRTKLSTHVYTSTEYDKTLKITMHNELSYSA